MKKLSSLPYPTLILLAGALLRLWGINAAAIWYDEAFTVNMARLPIGEMFAQQWLEYSPPLWNLIMRPFVHGPLWLLRTPAMLFSLASLYVVYLLMQKLEFTAWQQNLTAAMVAFLPGLLWTAQDARVYALLSLLYLLGWLYALENKPFHLAVVAALMLYAHNTAPFLLVTLYVLALNHHREEWRRFATTGAYAALSFVPWLPSVFSQSDSFWLGDLEPGWAMLQSVFAVWTNTLADIPALFFIALSLLSVVRMLINRHSDEYDIVTVALMPALLMLLVSLLFRNIFFYRPLIALVIPFAIWIAVTLPKNIWAKSFLTLGWALLLLAGLTNWNPITKGARLDNAAAYISEYWENGDVLYYTTGTVALPFDYYLHEKPHYLMNTEQNTGLIQLSHARAFDIPTGTLTPETVEGRVWVIHPDDVLISEATRESLAWVFENGRQVGLLEYAQAANVEIWLVGGVR